LSINPAQGYPVGIFKKSNRFGEAASLRLSNDHFPRGGFLRNKCWQIEHIGERQTDLVTGVKARVKQAHDVNPARVKTGLLFWRCANSIFGKIVRPTPIGISRGMAGRGCYADRNRNWTDATVSSTVH